MIPQHKIFPPNGLVCHLNENGKTTKQTYYSEPIIAEITPLGDKIYNVILYMGLRIKTFNRCWIMDAEGQPMEITPTSPNPFK